MRSICVSGVHTLLVVILAFPQFALAQAKGQVESIGFDNYFRPDCWTPMVVDLKPETEKSDQFQIQVRQEDLDRDHPIFSRTISLTGNADGGAGARQQKFRTYFRPQPTDGGLPDATDGSLNLRDLQDAVQVSLTTASGKWIAPLPITSTIQNLDPKTGSFSERRGMRFVLAVTDGRNAPPWAEYHAARGVLENLALLKVRPDQLPENVIGYDSVDAILWMNADPSELKSGTDERFRALESYVRRGGKLVICTPLDWQKILAFGELLPVTIESVQPRLEPEPVREIVRKWRERTNAPALVDPVSGSSRDPWDAVKGPFNIARATAKFGAIVEEWTDWTGPRQDSKAPTTGLVQPRDRTPWLVRRPFGSGGVTWVAQDLGAGVLTEQAKTGWPAIWDRVFDWKNDTRPDAPQITEREKEEFASASAVDIGAAWLSGMEHHGRSRWLITLAVVFFIGYWLVAGPGVYAWLATRRQTSASWFAFAASAVAATALTALLVRLTLRGDAELRHMSLVRQCAPESATVKSRFGLYIPRDGMQQIELRGMAPGSMAAISAFGIHPQYLSKAPDDPGPEYQVFLRDPASEEPVTVRVPYRSTLKKFDADWTGQTSGRVEGSGKLVEGRYIEGTLTNGTGLKLKNIYIAFKYPSNSHWRSDDWILYLPTWLPGTSLDLNREFNTDKDGNRWNFAQPDKDNPERGQKLRGTIRDYWQPFWSQKLRSGAFTGDSRDDFGQAVRTSVPVLSFFDRLEPLKNPRGQTANRFELLRRGARCYDVSAAVSSGALVVLAESDGPVPLPIPLQVEGEALQGQGSTVYQFVLPLDNGYFNTAGDEQPE